MTFPGNAATNPLTKNADLTESWLAPKKLYCKQSQ